MGVTGATGTLNSGLPELLGRIKQYSGNVPAAVGFGVSTREHFLSVASIADGVVIGSQIITTLTEAVPGERADRRHRQPRRDVSGAQIACPGSISRWCRTS